MGAARAALFCYRRKRRFYDTIKEQPTSEELFLFEGLNGRLGQSSSSRLVAPGRSFKLEGKKTMKELLQTIQLVYYIYVRKSTDVEDKQVLSVEAQIVELRKYAADNNMKIAGVIIEKKSAKKPGRKKFNAMMKDIEAGKANGILSWHPDRLARNSVDGGHIIYLLDRGLLQALKFPTFWFENTSQGKFMLSMAFSQSKYYVDNLSENTKRGLRQKVRRGEFPSKAPIGYINDVRTKSIVIDKRRTPFVVRAYELYASGTKRLVDIAEYLANNGIKTSGNKPLSKDQVKHMLKNPFYYGHFYYSGEVHEGKHKAIIDKKLFDRVQAVLARLHTPTKERATGSLWLAGVRYVQYGDYRREKDQTPKERQRTRICILPLLSQKQSY